MKSSGAFKALLASVSMASLFVGGVSTAVAQDAGGSLTGDVRRGDGGRGFAGVDVTIRELGVSAETGSDGRFRFSNVAPGAYTVDLSYLGEVIETRQVTVGAGGATLRFSLTDETLSETIVVTGTRGALANARAQERSRDNLTSVVTADDIGNFADQNIAESLQRIPGAAIQRSEGEGRTPAIRGLSEGFVTVTVDGTRLGSRTEDDAGDTRAVSLDVFSSDLLNGIEVSKTLLPDQDADAIGGTINLRTLSAFDRGVNSLAGRLEYGFQEKSEDWNPRSSFDFTRLFDVGSAGRFGIAGGVAWQRRNSLVDTVNVDNGLRSTVNGTAGEIIRIYDNVNTPPAPNPTIYVPGTSTTWTDPGNCATVLQTYCILAEEGIYSPLAIDLKSDPAERERLSGNLNLEWRPTARDEFFLRGTIARFTDEDIRNRQTFALDPALHEEIIELTANTAIFADADTEKRFRFSNQEDNLFTVALGGEHTRGAWTLDYQLDYSQNESDIPSAEARFRERDVIIRYTDLGIDGVQIDQYPDLDGTNANPADPSRFDFRFVTAYDFFTLDEIATAGLDLQRDFDAANRPGFLRFGVKRSERDRKVDVTRFRVDSPVPLTLAGFPMIPGGQIEGSDISFLFAPELGAMETFAWDLRENGVRQSSIINPGDEVISIARDYTANETVTAAYAMLNLELADRLEFTGGIRLEDTEWTSDGFVANRITYDEGAAEASTVIRNNLLAAGVTAEQILASSLGPRYSFNGVTLTPVSENAFATPNTGENNYTDMFFNLNLRWEPIDDIVLRASFTQGIQRPNFEQASANGEFRVDETTDVTDLAGLTTIAHIEQVVSFRGQAGTTDEPLRDPTLEPLRSNNYDMSLSWYPNSDTFFQVALFHKDISDFIVFITSNDAASFGFDPAEFDLVNTYINGEEAWVQGVELSYAQNYTFLPGLLSGLFFAGNVTLADSEQTDGVSGRTVTFQDQADMVANASIGWENDVFSLRVSGNYVGERLTALNAGALGLQFAASDEYERERTSVDVNARYSINDRIQIYADAINVNDAEERKFFQGGGLTGPIFSEIENYGATYQFGVRARF